MSWEPSSRAEVLAGPAALLLLSEEGDLALSSLPAELVQLAKPEYRSLSWLSSCHFGELPGRSAQGELGGRGAGRARGALQQVGRVALLPSKPPTAYKQHKTSKCLTGNCHHSVSLVSN